MYRYRYRVFISYSHKDFDKAGRVAEHLKSIDLKPVYDIQLVPGHPFREQIMTGIAYAHIFAPILTEESTKRTWVHQEIGYAMGLSVPVLPLAIGELPAGMIRDLQAISIQPDLSNLEEQVTRDLIDQVVKRPVSLRSQAVFECAELPEHRAEMLARHADEVLWLGERGRVMQLGALSSFSLPNKPGWDPVWSEREGKNKRSDYYHELQRGERVALEQHARRAGCDLIIDPWVPAPGLDRSGKACRLSTLVEFLKDESVRDVRVVIQRGLPARNALIVGDWFFAQSMAPKGGKGYYQTVATRHGPTVLNQMLRFEADFARCLEEQGLDGESSRRKAVDEIEEVIKGLR